MAKTTNFYFHSFSINLFIFTAFRVIKQQFQTLWLQSSVSTSGHFCSLGWTYCLELQNTYLCILTLVGQVMSMSVRVRYPKFICFVETYWQLAIFDIGNLLILNPQNLVYTMYKVANICVKLDMCVHELCTLTLQIKSR